jgi:hypothetical protein
MAETAAETAAETSASTAYQAPVYENDDSADNYDTSATHDSDDEGEAQLPAFDELQDKLYAREKTNADSSSAVFSTDALAYDSDMPILPEFDRPSVLEELNLADLDFENAESLGDIDMDALLREYSNDGHDYDKNN